MGGVRPPGRMVFFDMLQLYTNTLKTDRRRSQVSGAEDWWLDDSMALWGWQPKLLSRDS